MTGAETIGMHQTLRAALLATAFLVLAAPSEGGQRHKWWESGDVKSELRITDAQSESIDQIYEEAQPTLRSLMRRLNGQEEGLSSLIDAPNTTEADVSLQIDRGSSLHAER